VLGDQESDVFVSYARADDGVPLGADARLGWVSALAHNLNEGPSVYKKRIFIDHQLLPGDNFSEGLLAKVAASKLLVLLLSQNYVESRWCGDELAHFIRTHSVDPEKPTGVFVVELFPYEQLTGLPENIQRLRSQMIHAKFWYQRAAHTPRLAGYPSAKESGDEGGAHYWTVLNDLRVALDSRLRELRRQTEQGGNAAIAPPPVQQDAGTVLLADTTDDLEAQRNAVRIALQPEGIRVLPEGDYVGLQPAEFDAAFAADLAKADLFVQLLSPTVGRKGKGFEAPLPQLQFRRAQAAQVPILQWCAQMPAPGQIADPAHARLFETACVRATHLAEFKTSVIKQVRDARRRQPGPVAREPEAPPRPSPKPLVFLDDFGGEPALSERLRAIISEAGYQLRSLAVGAPLGNNGVDVQEYLRPCRAGITVCTDATKKVSVRSRLLYFLNQVAAGGLPLSRWGVHLGQGTVASEFGIVSDEVVPVDERGLAAFLRGL
jgi:hypothetical protein